MVNTTSSQGSRDTSASGARQGRRVTDGVMQGASNAVDTGLEYSKRALDKAGSKIRELRGSVEPVVDMLTSKAQNVGRQTVDMAGEAQYRARKSMNRAADKTSRYVTRQPVRSVMIAAAVGAAVVWVTSVARNRNRD